MFIEQSSKHAMTVEHGGDEDVHPYNGASAPPTERSKQVVQSESRPAHRPSNCACSLICRWRGSLRDCAFVNAYRKFDYPTLSFGVFVRIGLLMPSYIIEEIKNLEGSQIILWRNPWVSGSVFLSSLAVVISLKYWSALAALSFWMLSVMTLSALYKLASIIVVSVLGYSMPALPSFLAERWKLPDSSAEKFVDDVITRTNGVLDELQRVLLWDKVMHSLLFVGFLFLAFYVGRCFDTLTLLLIKIVALFTIPALIDRNQNRINHICRTVKDRMGRTRSSIAEKLPHKGNRSEKQE